MRGDCAKQVKLMADVSPHWSLLSAKLQKVCNLDGAVVSSWNARPAAENFGPPFLLSVSSYDRQGFLHGERPKTLLESRQCEAACGR